jgi:hypothetical protein
MKTLKTLLLITIISLTVACKKKENPKPPTPNWYFTVNTNDTQNGQDSVWNASKGYAGFEPDNIPTMPSAWRLSALDTAFNHGNKYPRYRDFTIFINQNLPDGEYDLSTVGANNLVFRYQYYNFYYVTKGKFKFDMSDNKDRITGNFDVKGFDSSTGDSVYFKGKFDIPKF